jgi:integrase/recombinase XerD
MRLFDAEGRRLYLTGEERRAFLAAAAKTPREVRTFCGVLHATGCRISEALALTAGGIDLSGRMIVFESLKKRRRGVYRAVPVPPALLDTLDLVHGIREAQRRGQGKDLLWPWSRMTAFRRVREVIAAAAIPDGPHACPKGLRHGFGVQAVSRGIALNMVQKWLGHAQLTNHGDLRQRRGLTLQLHFSLQVRALCGGLVCSPPE